MGSPRGENLDEQRRFVRRAVLLRSSCSLFLALAALALWALWEPGGAPTRAPGSAEIVFMGTGTSAGIPLVSCLVRRPIPCAACASALKPGSKDRRRNTGLLIRYPHADGRVRNIVVDVGKFWWASAMELFPALGIDRIDAILITHDHADAMGGLDDLRDFTNSLQESIPVFIKREDLEEARRRFPHLFDPEVTWGKGAAPQLDFRVVEENTPFDAAGLRVVPLPVIHGARKGTPYHSLGFRFGNFSYVSDVNKVPPATRELMRGSRYLVLDGTKLREPHPSHLSIEQAVEHFADLRPEVGWVTGLCHEASHAGAAEELLEEAGRRLRLDLRVPWDGLRLSLDL
eukprot:tig00020830_g14415.t1